MPFRLQGTLVRRAPETAGPYFTVALTNALIVDYALKSPADPEPRGFEKLEYEEIDMTHQKIEWTWTQGGITASDDWNARV